MYFIGDLGCVCGGGPPWSSEGEWILISCCYNIEWIHKLFFYDEKPLLKAKKYQEKFSDLLIIITTADENLIHNNTVNTSSLIWRGCMIFFELKPCLYVNSIPWLYIQGNFFSNFSKWRIFPNRILADFVIRFEKFLFQLFKNWLKRCNCFVCSLSGSGDIRKKTKGWKTEGTGGLCFFVIHCN